MSGPLVFADDFTTGAGILDGRIATTGQTWVEDLSGAITCDGSGAQVTGANNRIGRAPAYLLADAGLSVEFTVTNNLSTSGWSAVFTAQDPVTATAGVGLFVRRNAGSVEVFQATGLNSASGGVLHTFVHVAGETHTYRIESDGSTYTVLVDSIPVAGPSPVAFSAAGMYPAMRIQNLGSGATNKVFIQDVAMYGPEPAVGFWTNKVRTQEII